MNQTELVVLAVLSVRPATGYAVREVVHGQLGAFWGESFGQIYPAISRLVADGSVQPVEGGRAGSARYALTAAGRARLLDGLAAPPVPQRPRDGTLLRLFFGDLLGPAACADLVRQVRDRAGERIAELAAARAEVEGELAAGEPRARYWLMTISAGEHTARAALAWCEETLAALAGEPPPAGPLGTIPR
ncbi:PadR family transcriptional regulator [Kineococcus sp. SYSU DK002]|uniref:PadR family transcriptional regulator n=1 Tax=Kineococcus sp. SYSU DK002 TaxID=3383123 RepID=UPI003D7EC222